MADNVHSLSGTDPRALCTEILFALACARVAGESIVCFLPTGADRKCERMVLRILKSMKKEGKIDFFVTTADLAAGTTEADYLENKYPDAIIDRESDTPYLYVKVRTAHG